MPMHWIPFAFLMHCQWACGHFICTHFQIIEIISYILNLCISAVTITTKLSNFHCISSRDYMKKCWRTFRSVCELAISLAGASNHNHQANTQFEFPDNFHQSKPRGRWNMLAMKTCWRWNDLLERSNADQSIQFICNVISFNERAIRTHSIRVNKWYVAMMCMNASNVFEYVSFGFDWNLSNSS